MHESTNLDFLLLFAILILSATLLHSIVAGPYARHSANPYLLPPASVSLVIPCVPKHIPLLYDLLQSADAQSLRPGEVIVALSQTSDAEWHELARDLASRYPKLNIVGAPIAGTANAAKNRNRGARMATQDVISFMDADDLMHPNRLEVIVAAFMVHRPHGVLHAHGEKNEESQTPFQDAASVKTHVVDTRKGENCTFDKVHHAHFSVLSSVFSRESQDEAEHWARREDSEYVIRLVQKGYSLIFVPHVLSKYRQEYSLG